MLVDYSEFLARGGEIQTTHGRTDLQQIDGKWIVHEYLDHLTAFESHQQTLATRRTARHFDVTDQRVQNPFFLFHAGERVTLKSCVRGEEKSEWGWEGKRLTRIKDGIRATND